MSISNYSELVQAIEKWTKRTDLGAVIPDFIALTDARINRVFIPRDMEQEVELSMVAGSRFVDLPEKVINPIGVWLKAWLPRQRLTQTLPEQLPVKTNATGYPEYWAIDGERIAFDKLAQESFKFDFRYTKEFALSQGNPTNYVLTNCPDLYLWGALAEASVYQLDEARAAVYEQRFQAALKDAQANENDTRATSPLMTDFGSMGRQGRFNIIRGY